MICETGTKFAIFTMPFVGSPRLVGKFIDNRLNCCVGDTKGHRACTATHFHFEAYDDNHFVGGHDLDKSRVGFRFFLFEMDGKDGFPDFIECINGTIDDF